MDPKRQIVLEQYKSLVEDVGNIGQRYATSNGFYLSVLTALLGVLAYVGSGQSLEKINLLIIVLVAVFATVICWIWRETIAFYGRLFSAKFCLLKRLEAELEVPVYAEEAKLVYRERDPSDPCKAKEGGKSFPPLTAHEAKVPKYLGWFFLAIAAVALIGAVFFHYQSPQVASTGHSAIPQHEPTR